MCSLSRHRPYRSGFHGSWGLLPYGDRLRSTKRLTAKVLSSKACQDYAFLQNEHVVDFLQRLGQSSLSMRENTHLLVSLVS